MYVVVQRASQGIRRHDGEIKRLGTELARRDQTTRHDAMQRIIL